ncbi:hypothetical protein UFOVP124_63 [uncultured Caudovirales phage]|uniref:Uncharacterized protein n=1 Tax=uncultured Caudovirales phage TaxID=2100421 RepID=A0A6J5LCH7_9CAUD|nr:hypothetical protein UFOVP124_63 [uncultured Caudovirales phage]
MKVTTEQLVIDLYHLHREGKAGYSNSQKIQCLLIIDKLDSLPDWAGRTVRTLEVPVFGCGVVLRLERTREELLATFERLERPLGLGSFEEWRGDCETCGAATVSHEESHCENCRTAAAVLANRRIEEEVAA